MSAQKRSLPLLLLLLCCCHLSEQISLHSRRPPLPAEENPDDDQFSPRYGSFVALNKSDVAYHVGTVLATTFLGAAIIANWPKNVTSPAVAPKPAKKPEESVAANRADVVVPDPGCQCKEFCYANAYDSYLKEYYATYGQEANQQEAGRSRSRRYDRITQCSFFFFFFFTSEKRKHMMMLRCLARSFFSTRFVRFPALLARHDARFFFPRH